MNLKKKRKIDYHIFSFNLFNLFIQNNFCSYNNPQSLNPTISNIFVGTLFPKKNPSTKILFKYKFKNLNFFFFVINLFKSIMKNINLCFCSDFFYPDIGGIETHIFQLAKHLNELGIKKIIGITRNRKDFEGYHLIDNFFHIYYLKRFTFKINSSFPSLWFSISEISQIFKKENITHVHCHQSTSSIAFECGIIAKILKLKLFFTEHSLFSLGDFGSIHLNNGISNLFRICDKVIAVSNIQALNIQKRVNNLKNIIIIPNGIDLKNFYRNSIQINDYPIFISVTRFEKRKGCSLLSKVISKVCKNISNAKWIIVGDGTLFFETKNYLQKFKFFNRITLLGSINHSDISSILRKGHYFVNCSLTDSFNVSILEAAACGLYIISTNVGGISEILPKKIISLCSPCSKEITKEIIYLYKNKIINNYKNISFKKYLWKNISKKLLKIYNLNFKSKNIVFKLFKYNNIFYFFINLFIFITYWIFLQILFK